MAEAGGVDLVRTARLGAFAISATVLALGAHVAAGGAPPTVVPTLAAVALPGAAGYALTRRRRGRLEIAVVLGAVQLVLHEIFTAAASAGHGVPAGQVSHGGHGGHGGEAGTAALWMSAAHVAAVLLAALLLARGERVLHLLSGWLRSVPVLPGRLGPPAPLARPPVASAAGVPRYELPSRRACAPLVRRGPPLPCC